MPTRTHDVVVVGGGAAGLAVAARLLRRRPGLDLAVVEPSEVHVYQPGLTLVAAGMLRPQQIVRPMAAVMPRGAEWIAASVAAFDPEQDALRLSSGATLGYRMLVAAPGLKLDWKAVRGLLPALGAAGVTSNYRPDLAAYTLRLVQAVERGRALFTQPAPPLTGVGASHNALFLAADHWMRTGHLSQVEIEFHQAGDAPGAGAGHQAVLDRYMTFYGAEAKARSELVAVDGPRRRAVFRLTDETGGVSEVRLRYDMLHVCPPQAPHDVVRDSALAGPQGWIDVGPRTLRHPRFPNVFALGDAAGTANARSAASIRRQAPVVAENLLAQLDGRSPGAAYDAYAGAPLAVERGKVVLGEFDPDGRPAPTLPAWMLDGRRPSRRAWVLMTRIFPELYWNGLLKGRVGPRPRTGGGR